MCLKCNLFITRSEGFAKKNAIHLTKCSAAHNSPRPIIYIYIYIYHIENRHIYIYINTIIFIYFMHLTYIYVYDLMLYVLFLLYQNAL